jgi:prevent-host-death family protein
MTKRVSSAQAKAQFSALVAQVADGGEHVIIERRGKPLAALVSVDELQRLEIVAGRGAADNDTPPPSLPPWIGAWGDLLTDEEIDTFIADVAEARGRPLAASASVDEQERIDVGRAPAAQPQGALALVGAWADALTDEEINAFVADVYAARERDLGRPVDLGE